MSVVGIDGCASGWVAVEVDGDRLVRVEHLPAITVVTEVFPAAELAGIDIPMTFPAPGSVRLAEVAARHALRGRRSSIFLTPPRTVLACDEYAAANELARATHGAGISRQAYGLRTKILEVEAWRAARAVPAFEVHPELSFSVLLGAPATHSKKSWGGMVERRDALAARGLTVPDVPDAVGRAAVDDVLDAVVAAWTAERIRRGDALRFPADGVVPDAECIWA
jgi:predicted RNase H-like nuclease